MKNVILVSLILLLAGCGSSGTSTSSGGTVTVSGTVESPTTVSGNISVKGHLTKAISDTAASGLTGTLYNLDGDTVGTFTTGSDGTYSISANVDTIQPDDATGTSWTAQLVAVTTNSTGTTNVETYVEASVVEGTTTTISMGTSDTETTLAAQALRKKGSCTAWGQDCASGFTSIDPFCYFKAQHQVWSDSDTSGSGMKDDTGIVKDLIRGGMAGGVKPSDLGYTDWPTLTEAIYNGTLDSADLTTLATTAASATGVSASTYTSNYASATSVFSTLETILGTQLSGGEGLSVVASTSKATTADGSACDSIKDATVGSDYLDSLIGVFMAAETTSELATYGRDDDAFKLMIGMVDQYRVAGDFTKIKAAPEAFMGYLAGLSSTQIDGYFAGGALKAADMTGLTSIFSTIDTTDTRDATGWRDWGKSWEGTVEELGFDAFKTGDTFNADKLEYYGEYFDGQIGQSGTSFDPGAINFATLGEQLGTNFGTLSGAQQGAFDTCVAAGGTFSTCSGGQTAPPPGDFELPVGEQQTNVNLAGSWTCTGCVSTMTLGTGVTEGASSMRFSASGGIIQGGSAMESGSACSVSLFTSSGSVSCPTATCAANSITASCTSMAQSGNTSCSLSCSK